jgi:hypothetical protein
MQNSELADANLLPIESQINRSSMAREESRFVNLLDPIAIGLLWVFSHFVIHLLAFKTLFAR